MSKATARVAVLDYHQAHSDRARKFLPFAAAERMWQIGLLERVSKRIFRRIAAPSRIHQSNSFHSAPHTLQAQLDSYLKTADALQRDADFTRLLPSAELPGLRFLIPLSAEQRMKQRTLRAEAFVYCASQQWA